MAVYVLLAVNGNKINMFHNRFPREGGGLYSALLSYKCFILCVLRGSFYHEGHKVHKE